MRCVDVFAKVLDRGLELDALEDVIHDDYVCWENGRVVLSGKQGVHDRIAMLHEAFPDGRQTSLERVHAGDRVIERWVFRGTHRGPFMGMPPTGATVEMHGISIVRVADDRVREVWQSYDSGELLAQFAAAARASGGQVA